jgi:sodium transport system permease protein
LRLSEISLSFCKEMTEVFRDRRTLLITLAFPVLVFPVFDLFLAMTANSVSQQSSTRVTRVCFAASDGSRQDKEPATAPDPLAELKQEFRLSKRIKLLQPAGNLTAESLILKGIADVVVSVSPTFAADVTACKPARIELYDNACADYSTDEQNVWEPVRKFADSQRARRLASYNIPGEKTRTVQVSVKTVESQRSRSAGWAAMLYTVMLMLAMCLSSMYPALDLITGERERGTLVLLLMAPGDRRSYVCGKLLTVSFVTLLSAVLTMIAATMSISLFVTTTQDLSGSFRLSLPIGDLLLASIFLVPIAVAISASSILLSSYARSFQQGQSYFAPLVLFGIMVCGIVLSCEESAPFFVNLVPVANLMLCMYRAIQGHWQLAAIIAALVSSALYLVLLVRVSVSILDREESLFGIKQAPGQRTTFVKEAVLLFAGCLAAFFYLLPALQAAMPVWGLLVAQAVCIGLPALAAPRLLKMPLAKTLSLSRGTLWSAAGAVLMIPCLALLATLVARWQSSIVPDSEAYIKALQDYLFPKGADAWTAYLTIAIGPAVCEELLFRGAIQGMLRPSFSKPLLCCLVAVMFGIMHGSSFRFLPTSLMGFVLCLITECTGSLLPAILLHAGNNALAVWQGGQDAEPSALLICLSVALAGAGVLALRRGHKLRRDS